MSTDHENRAKQRYLALQRRARDDGRPTDELLVLYALEGFLARLSASPDCDDFVLKGGMLLAAFGTRRPTRDVDMQAQAIANDVDVIREAVRAIAMGDQDDGLTFDHEHVEAEVIREGDDYSGVRVSLDAGLHTGKMKLKVDVNVGDPIWPEPQSVEVPRLLGGDPIRLVGYPLHMVLAEKIATAVARGQVNTRWRDFGDVYLLSQQHDIEGADLQQAIDAVSSYRQVEAQELAVVLEGYADLSQQRWEAWVRRRDLDDRLPTRFTTVLEAVVSFADPALRGEVTDRRWDPTSLSWDIEGHAAPPT